MSATRSGQSDAVHLRARAFLDKADIKSGCEIHAVNTHLEATTSSANETPAIREYYSRLEQLVEEGARYKRIIQLSREMANAPYDRWVTETKEHYRQHFSRVLELQDMGKSAQLWQALPRFPLSFVLIQNTNGSNYLIWQVDEQVLESPQGQAKFRLHGIFLVEDPDREVTSHFLWYCDQLIQNGKVVQRVIE